MNQTPRKTKLYWKLFFSGIILILLIVFLIDGCGVDFGALGFSFHISSGLF